MALVKAFIPDKWGASTAQPAPVCAATSLNFTAVCEGDGGFDAIPPPVSQVHLIIRHLHVGQTVFPCCDRSSCMVVMADACCIGYVPFRWCYIIGGHLLSGF